VLQRSYVDSNGSGIMLCVAYGSEQSPALQVHRPEICYASSGFKVGEVERTAVQLAGHRLPVARLHATMVGRSEPVTYWMVLGDSAVADTSSFRWRQLSISLRREIKDGMLVRVSSIGRDATPGRR